MCDIYTGVDEAVYRKTSRSLRLHGHVTSLSLENRFWSILEEMALREGVSIGQFITRLYDECLQRRGEVVNFTSLLRVACTTYLLRR
ncbi:ribbon-helix-helix domain-containing protein [Gynuella sunshinyii]|uniref:Ribbon-helix-helix domain-containing protein n=1 Tax=Gynuella sunshinyii YC6258 TaxID=1445510 RepID=A0A0C5VMM2_9GAMM|nr:ribbon-helix-helix domain-containing protein [Gynuella sunshinyii]AJQ95977.1 putative protein-like arylsulfate sulfotransferase involved in siderophore biosynthesis [Gynuella sunshinyii YC6258]